MRTAPCSTASSIHVPISMFRGCRWAQSLSQGFSKQNAMTSASIFASNTTPRSSPASFSRCRITSASASAATSRRSKKASAESAWLSMIFKTQAIYRRRYDGSRMKFVTRLCLFAALSPWGAQCADLVLRNGKIVTLDPAAPEVQAIAITSGRVVARGSNAQMAREIQPSTKVIDLNGRLAIPGFIEGHGHFTGIGQMKMNLNLRDAKNWDAIVAMVAAAAREAKPGEWILGRGWHQEKWDSKPAPNVNGFPVHDSLSKVSPNNPVYLTHASGHAAFVNGAAMKAAGITRDTKNPEGGEIQKDSAGNPTGLMNEKAQALVGRVVPPPDVEKEIDLAAQECISKGVTSFEDAGSSADVIERMKKRAAAGTLPLRLWVMLRPPGDSNDLIFKDAARLRMIGFGNDFLTVRAIKKQIDGALGTRGAWMLAPYSDLPSTSGFATETPDDIEKAAQIAIANGYQLCVHAIGDRANREVLNLYERTFKAHPDQHDL